MNPNIEYEKYIKDVFLQILKEEGIGNTKVQHDIRLKGKTATHQIDVYWEYMQFGEMIKVAVECKRYVRNVSIGVVRDFHSVLQDINCSKGIIVTTTGFQRGAIEYASKNNISLKVIRMPNEEELSNRLKKLSINVVLIKKTVTNVFLGLDKEWCLANVHGIDKDFSNVYSKINTEIVLVDRNGIKLANMLDLENQLPVNSSPARNEKYSYRYADAYLIYESNKLLKVSEIEFTYDVGHIEDNREFDLHSQIRAIIKDCIENKSTFLIDKNYPKTKGGHN